ncbi:MAG: DUF3368 domain-containing protein [Anaerolineales bacterium]|nr:DUF3368 domain-containing protein [Anaerolineales bacterium]
MPVVSDTSPVLNLAIVGHLSLLRQQFGRIWIPPAVIEELRVKDTKGHEKEEDLPGSRAVREAIGADWLRVEEVEDHTLVKILRRDLDGGEAEAIALALQMKANRVLLDEREGRRVAKSLGLKVTGVLGVLLRAKRLGHLLSLQEAMEQLQEQAGFCIGRELFADVLREGGVRGPEWQDCHRGDGVQE